MPRERDGGAITDPEDRAFKLAIAYDAPGANDATHNVYRDFGQRIRHRTLFIAIANVLQKKS
jgi:hypothetical protein